MRMDLETIIQSEISQTGKTNTLSYHIYVESGKNGIDNLIYKVEIET